MATNFGSALNLRSNAISPHGYIFHTLYLSEYILAIWELVRVSASSVLLNKLNITFIKKIVDAFSSLSSLNMELSSISRTGVLKNLHICSYLVIKDGSSSSSIVLLESISQAKYSTAACITPVFMIFRLSLTT